MSQSRDGRPVTAGGSRANYGTAALAAVCATAISLLAGCGASSASSGTGAASTGATAATGATASAGATAGPSSTAVATGASSAAAAFVPVTEPFDPGHPARATSAPASCVGQQTTLAIEQCFEDKTETADAAIDAVRQASFASASAAQQGTINSADSGWLAARATVCAKAYQTGGTIDGINIASCLLDESTARLDGLKGITPAEAVLKSTDSPSPSDLSWYTTPEGTRIAMMSAQGDETGGAIIEWFIIAGADGFAVNPAQFSYVDGAFTDAGKAVQGASPSGHMVTPGTEYQFGIDYSRLASDPNAGKGGGWVYAPGAPVAVWR
ncbi:MAG: lysozyme inhibitor LprI family protein [Trebonia sp.]